MTVHISTGCFQCKSLDEIVALACKHGFDLELSSSLAYSSNMLNPVFLAQSKVGFLLHNYFPPPAVPFVLNLASSNIETRSRSFNFCLEAISLCADIGIPFYSVHAGYAMEMDIDMLGKPHLQGDACRATKTDRGQAYQTFVETIRNLAKFAGEKQVGLLVENNVLAVENLASDGTSPLLLADVDEIKKFFSDLCCTGVGLILDVGHAKVSAETLKIKPQSYFDELGPFIRCLHLSDNDSGSDSHRPFSVRSWFVSYLKKYEQVPMVLEVYHSSLSEILEQRSLLMSLLDLNPCDRNRSL